jgi:hypothetical protein
MRGFLAGPGIDLSNGHFGTLAREKNRGGAADPVTGTRDEGYLACKPCHRSLLLDRKSKNKPEAGGSPCDIVAASEAG